jgi:hypothetical protein
MIVFKFCIGLIRKTHLNVYGKVFSFRCLVLLNKTYYLEIPYLKKKSNLFSRFCRLIKNKIFLLLTLHKHDCNYIL